MVKNTQTIRWQQPTNCLSVINHFVGFALKGLNMSENLLAELAEESGSAHILSAFRFVWQLVDIKFHANYFCLVVDTIKDCKEPPSDVEQLALSWTSVTAN